jgi:hypothetical protein
MSKKEIQESILHRINKLEFGEQTMPTRKSSHHPPSIEINMSQLLIIGEMRDRLYIKV